MLAMPAFNLASGALRSLFVDRLDDNPDPLVLAEVEIGRWLEDPMRVDGFGESRHLKTSACCSPGCNPSKTYRRLVANPLRDYQSYCQRVHLNGAEIAT